MWAKTMSSFSLTFPLTSICWDAQMLNWCDNIIHLSFFAGKVLCNKGMLLIWEMFWITSLLALICGFKRDNKGKV